MRNTLIRNNLTASLVEIVRFAPDQFVMNERFDISRFDQNNAV
jgi:hypothetical protein